MLVVILHPVSGVGLQEFVGGVLNLPHIVNVNRSIKLWCVEQIQLVYQLVLQFLQPDAGISGGATQFDEGHTINDLPFDDVDPSGDRGEGADGVNIRFLHGLVLLAGSWTGILTPLLIFAKAIHSSVALSYMRLFVFATSELSYCFYWLCMALHGLSWRCINITNIRSHTLTYAHVRSQKKAENSGKQRNQLLGKL